MIRVPSILALGLALGTALGGCNKPAPEACKKALLNMQRILGTDLLNKTSDIEGDVRRCRGGSTKEAVECASAAQTKEDLVRCEFYKQADPAAAPAGGSSDKPADGK